MALACAPKPMLYMAGKRDEVFHVEFDESDDVAATVVRSVAAILGCPPLDLTPLGAGIDTEMLAAMVEQGSGGTTRRGEYTFTYEGFEVTVDTGGDIWIERI